MQEAVSSGAMPTNIITGALRSVGILRAVLHPFNKRIAEVIDYLSPDFGILIWLYIVDPSEVLWLGLCRTNPQVIHLLFSGGR